MIHSPGENASNKHFDRLLRISAGSQLVQLKVFPDAKELTESFGAFAAVVKFREFFSLDDSSITLVAVADGKTPATAVTFALQTRWKCHSVDPRLRPDKRWSEIPRLALHASRLEETEIHADRLIVVAVHAHITVQTVLHHLPARETLLVFMPCCVPAEHDRPPDLEYDDMDVLSGARTVKIWREAGPDLRQVRSRR